MEVFVRFGNAFDCLNRVPIGLRRQKQAGPDGCSIQQNSAGAADPVFAADVGARQTNLMPEHVCKMRSRLNGYMVFRAIDAHCDGVAIRHVFCFQPE